MRVRMPKNVTLGDLGNLEADKNGLARLEVTDNVISLEGPNRLLAVR